MKKGRTIEQQSATGMPVSRRTGAHAAELRESGAPTTYVRFIPDRPGIHSSSVLILAAIAFAVPAAVFGLFADDPALPAKASPAAIGLRGSLPVADAPARP